MSERYRVTSKGLSAVFESPSFRSKKPSQKRLHTYALASMLPKHVDLNEKQFAEELKVAYLNFGTPPVPYKRYLTFFKINEPDFRKTQLRDLRENLVHRYQRLADKDIDGYNLVVSAYQKQSDSVPTLQAGSSFGQLFLHIGLALEQEDFSSAMDCLLQQLSEINEILLEMSLQKEPPPSIGKGN